MPSPDFDPTLFAHGRLLWRHAGSDGARFSPALAWALVERAVRANPGATLWDPFCGIGLIPCLARLFFWDRLGGVLASDLSEAAVATTQRNLAVVSSMEGAQDRLRTVRGRRGQNPKSERRWGEVEACLQALLPRIASAAAADVPTRARVAAAHVPAPGSGPLIIVADAPYGTTTTLAGPPLVEVLGAWLDDERIVRIDLVVPADIGAQVADALPALELHAVRGRRARLTLEATPAPGDAYSP
jgi:hypothetical protein